MKKLLTVICLLASLSASAKVEIVGTDVVPAQNDSWSCGPNALARLFNFYGSEVDYELLKVIMPRSLRFDSTEFGPTPKQIQSTVDQLSDGLFAQVPGKINGLQVKENASLDEIYLSIDSNTPVIALLRLQNAQFFGFEFPLLHYVIPVDYTMNSFGLITHLTYMDSDGVEKTVTIQDFQKYWMNWNVNLTATEMMFAINYLCSQGGEIVNESYLSGNTLLVPSFSATDK